MVLLGIVWQAWYDKAGIGSIWWGYVWCSRNGTELFGRVLYGQAGLVRFSSVGTVRWGTVRSGRRGLVLLGTVGLGLVRFGRKGFI